MVYQYDIEPKADEDKPLDLKKAFLDAYHSSHQKDRYKKFGLWVFDRWIFTVAMLLIFGWLYFVASSYNFELDYFECGEASEFYDAGVKCDNPFYEPVTWKNYEELGAGVYGQKPGPLFKSVFYVPVVMLALAFGANFLIHNRRGKK